VSPEPHTHIKHSATRLTTSFCAKQDGFYQMLQRELIILNILLNVLLCHLKIISKTEYIHIPELTIFVCVCIYDAKQKSS
jgi:hypothetical protein